MNIILTLALSDLDSSRLPEDCLNNTVQQGSSFFMDEINTITILLYFEKKKANFEVILVGFFF